MAGDVRNSAWRLGQQTRQGSSRTAKVPKCREDYKVGQEDITAVEIGNGKRPTRILTPLVGVLAGGCGVDRGGGPLCISQTPPRGDIDDRHRL